VGKEDVFKVKKTKQQKISSKLIFHSTGTGRTRDTGALNERGTLRKSRKEASAMNAKKSTRTYGSIVYPTRVKKKKFQIKYQKKAIHTKRC